MKCEQCGFENKDSAKFCTKCGNSLIQKTPAVTSSSTSNSTKYVILALIAVIIILIASIGYFAFNQSGNLQADGVQNADSKAIAGEDSQSDGSSQQNSQGSSNSKGQSSSTEVVESKSWQSIGTYSGSGSGSQTISVPAGKIMVKLSAFPIKNYATNHLHVSGSNGQSGGVDWGPTSDVETRSDSFEYTSSSSETFTIDYNETVSWEVEFLRYQ